MNHSEIVSFVWGVADLIRDTFKRGKYQDVILPLTVLRRLDCVLAGSKQKVLGKQAELKDIPHVDDYARTEDDRKVFGLIFGTQALGRLYLSPPAMPAARKAALRKALLDTMKDPEFIADAAKTQIDISPMRGEEVEAFIERLSSASPAVIERTKQAFRND